ncbi:hypothetical protein [Azospirillum brasilense]|uniref:hypothetical protein n=1 Tax=Azospirillum brasilense TaxID=192 RepID=UPI0013B35E1A|nr:hypothetical protein [Azospirillum brasilense]
MFGLRPLAENPNHCGGIDPVGENGEDALIPRNVSQTGLNCETPCPSAEFIHFHRAVVDGF